MTVALIPARGGSKRIVGKNLKLFCGRPLVSWTIMQALRSRVDGVVVSTDDVEIAEASLSYGAEVIERPPEISQDTSTLEDVINHCIGAIECDSLICLQPTSPLRFTYDIDFCLEILKFIGGVVSCNVEPDLFLWEKQKAVTFQAYPRRLRGEFIRENGSIYGVRVDRYMSSRYADEFEFYPMKKWQSFELDSLEDWEVCEYFFRRYNLHLMKEGKC